MPDVYLIGDKASITQRGVRDADRRSFAPQADPIKSLNHMVARGAAPIPFSYKVYGLRLVCDQPLPELGAATPPAGVDFGTVEVKLAAPEGTTFAPRNWFLKGELVNGEPWLFAARVDGDFALRYSDLAEFLIDKTATRVSLSHAARRVRPETIRHLLLDQVLPTMLSLRGQFVLHATAVETPKGSCAFIGRTGSGKSTLSASFCLAGYPSLGDDCLVVRENGKFYPTPGYPGVRLWPLAARALLGAAAWASPVAHYTVKQRLLERESALNFPAGDKPLATIYLLQRQADDDDGRLPGPIIQRPSPREAFMHLVSSSFFLDAGDEKLLAGHFRAAQRLAGQVPVRVLKVPNDLSALPAVREAVLLDLGL